MNTKLFGLLTLGGCALLAPVTALAQASANPVTAADDAFGFANGDEAVGIYDATSVRGFDLEAAGNYRVNGAYFVKSSGVSNFFVDTTTVRIGLNTLSLDYPGPSGVVDFRLRDPARGEPSLLTGGLDEFVQPYLDMNLRHRSADNRFSASLGLGLVFDKNDNQGGSDGKSWLLGGTTRLSVGPATLRVFGGEYDYERNSRLRFTFADPQARPRLERGDFLGQDWAIERGQRRIAGVLVDTPLSDAWSLGVNGVFSQEDPGRSYSQLLLGVDDDGVAARSLIVASRDRRFTAWSGEARATWTRQTQTLAHRVTFTARSRWSRNHFGGDRIAELGALDVHAAPTRATPLDLSGAGPTLRDRIDQTGLGVSYRLGWKDRATLNMGVLRTDYEKTFQPATGAAQSSSSSPLLYNLGGAVSVARGVDLYGSYSRGLEEAGTAPSSAANRNQVLNAILVTQRELGLRYAISPGLSLIIAGFDTRKPYAGVDPANQYRLIGDVRHRGIESSLSGKLSKNLSVVLGGVYIDPHLDRGPTAALGPRPVGVPKLQAVANVSYAVVAIPGLTVDAGADYTGRRPFRSALSADGEQAQLAADLTVNAGLRYRLPIYGGRTTLRAQVLNLFNDYGLTVNGAETLDYTPQRRFRLVLTQTF
ncbi:TonB-dependent receptor [Caulobacter sp. NIBR2454]|uniref:TonB-dependent receptor n=1 Tax=Caulobacter sp. NIBR2454 TaxID=3015996 RepID=UPI0022B7436C|nr:TonB-dependent receptor [Caulobacter sp. NIBR2454]